MTLAGSGRPAVLLHGAGGATFEGGQAYMRFRLTTDDLAATQALRRGAASEHGEVEDYVAPVACVGNLVWYDLNKNGIQDDGAAFSVQWDRSEHGLGRA